MFKKQLKPVGTIASSLALVIGLSVSQSAFASDPFIGQIQMVGFNFAPRGWAFCDGQILPITQHTALFSLLGTTYGGDGRTTFGLPDLRGRVAIHPGNGPGLSSYSWGERGGVETVTLTQGQMPSHNHTAVLRGKDDRGDNATPNENSLAGKKGTKIYSSETPDVNLHVDSINIGDAGGNQAHENRMPYLSVYHTIALEGIFPSRN